MHTDRKKEELEEWKLRSRRRQSTQQRIDFKTVPAVE